MKGWRIPNAVSSESSLLKLNMPVMISTALSRSATRYRRLLSRGTGCSTSGFFVGAVVERSCTAKRVPIFLSVERISVSIVSLMTYDRTIQCPSYVIDNSIVLFPTGNSHSCSTISKESFLQFLLQLSPPLIFV